MIGVGVLVLSARGAKRVFCRVRQYMKMERMTGFEPATHGLGSRCPTTGLHPLARLFDYTPSIRKCGKTRKRRARLCCARKTRVLRRISGLDVKLRIC